MNNPSGLKFAFEAHPLRAGKSHRKQPVQSRSQATCAAILEATVQVIVRQGADKLTTTRIAERAGVSVGTLYQYFPNKAALVEAVRADYFRLMSEAVQTVMAYSGDLTLEQKLRGALVAVVDVKRENSALSIALAKIPSDTEAGDFAADVVQHFATFLLSLISKGREPSDSLRAKVHLQVAALEGALAYAVKNEPGWLEQPWFIASLQDLIRTNLLDDQRDGAGKEVPSNQV